MTESIEATPLWSGSAPETSGELGSIDVVDAVCVDYIDLGKNDTPWGLKSQCKYVFETEVKKENGYPVTVTRTFTNSMHEKSALRGFIRDWRGEDLDCDEVAAFKAKKMVGKPCKLKVQDAISKNGFAYLKALGIAPADERKLEPSGSYRRFDPINN